MLKLSRNHGGHLEFPINKRFTSLVQDHPMIIPAVTIQLAWWFQTRRFFKISANENTLWALAAMLDFKSAANTQIW
jgi:hypothetical protein